MKIIIIYSWIKIIMGAEVAMVTRVMPSSHDMIIIFVPCTLHGPRLLQNSSRYVHNMKQLPC